MVFGDPDYLLATNPLAANAITTEREIDRDAVRSVDHYGRIVMPVENIRAAAARGVRFAGLSKAGGQLGYVQGLMLVPPRVLFDGETITAQLRGSLYPRDRETSINRHSNLTKCTLLELEANEIFCEWEIVIRIDDMGPNVGDPYRIRQFSYRATDACAAEFVGIPELYAKIKAEKERRRALAK